MPSRVAGQLRISRLARTYVLSCLFALTHHALRITHYPPRRTRLWRAHYALLLFVLCSLTAYASAAEILTGEGTVLKRVTILKQPISDHDQSENKTGKTFFVEEITDLPGLKKGLSLRESMPEDQGMLFVLDASQEHAFWMKGMRFPLDIIFIGKKMQVSEILENLQPCEKCPMYFPKGRPAYAVEINAGLANKLGITIGDTLVIEK